jgi:hypothetical protein
MSPLFGRRPRPIPDSDEPVGIILDPHAARIAEIDAMLARCVTPFVRDVLLDERLTLRPPRPATVPVVPGKGGEGGSRRE